MWCALKYERSCLKGLGEKNPSSDPPADILNKEWQKLIMYWNSLKQMAKSLV
jgi:hypothetical protein